MISESLSVKTKLGMNGKAFMKAVNLDSQTTEVSRGHQPLCSFGGFHS